MIDHIPYQIARPAIRSGDLLAWTHSAPPWRSWYDFKVWAVRLFQMSEYSHVGIALVEDGRVKVIEAVTPRPRIAYLSGELPVYHVQMNVDWTPELDAYAKHFTTDERYVYSSGDAMLSLLRKNDRGNYRIECAELCNLVFARAGISLDGRDTPHDVVKAAQCRGGGVYLLEDAQ